MHASRRVVSVSGDRSSRMCQQSVHAGGERQTHPLDQVKVSSLPLIFLLPFPLCSTSIFFSALHPLLLPLLPVGSLQRPMPWRRVGVGRQLAYSRDQSSGTRATRINDHQQNDSFFTECARDKSRFRCLRRHPPCRPHAWPLPSWFVHEHAAPSAHCFLIHFANGPNDPPLAFGDRFAQVIYRRAHSLSGHCRMNLYGIIQCSFPLQPLMNYVFSESNTYLALFGGV